MDGDFLPQKNHEFLVKVFAKYVQKVLNSVLMLIGKEDDFRNIEKL